MAVCGAVEGLFKKVRAVAAAVEECGTFGCRTGAVGLAGREADRRRRGSALVTGYRYNGTFLADAPTCPQLL